MRIGELGQTTGVTAKTIRYYEEIGLLAEPDRSSNGYRDYKDQAVDRLLFIRDAQASGLTLTEIASVLELRDQGEQTCRHVVQLLEEHLADIDRQIRRLHKTRELLAAMTERARSLDPSDCSDPNRCQTISPDAAAHEGLPGARGLAGQRPSERSQNPGWRV